MIPQKGEGRLFIVLPTLETMLSSCDNSKMRAQGAGMEYSNFRKHCKMQTDLRIDTYTKCASAFDMDVLLLHLPKGMIESLVHDHKRMIQHIIFLANRIVKKQNNMSEFRDMMEAIEKLIKKLMHNDRE